MCTVHILQIINICTSINPATFHCQGSLLSSRDLSRWKRLHNDDFELSTQQTYRIAKSTLCLAGACSR
jgi:hypothetical protein